MSILAQNHSFLEFAKNCSFKFSEIAPKAGPKIVLQQLLGKTLHGRFFNALKDDRGIRKDGPRSWDWVKSGYLKGDGQKK